MRQLHAEIIDGELQLSERQEAVLRFRGKLGLGISGKVQSSSRPSLFSVKRRPGQRLPTLLDT